MSRDACKIDKSVALELIAKIGNDEKQHNGHFRFAPFQKVSNFFHRPHDVADNMLSKNQLVVDKKSCSNFDREEGQRQEVDQKLETSISPNRGCQN